MPAAVQAAVSAAVPAAVQTAVPAAERDSHGAAAINTIAFSCYCCSFYGAVLPATYTNTPHHITSNFFLLPVTGTIGGSQESKNINASNGGMDNEALPQSL